ncbi:MAG: hypothetical protein NTW21_11405 [Verrucomicrobia bacterium]|nr:hypothetical protein [Verrucomicrobiota bacterium]
MKTLELLKQPRVAIRSCVRNAALLATVLTMVSGSARAELIVYEGFNYTDQSDDAALNGDAFSGGTGLSGTWSGTGACKYRTAGLTFSDFPVSSGSGCAGVSGTSFGFRQLAVDQTGTIWGGFLFKSVSAVDTSDKVGDLYVAKVAAFGDYDLNSGFGVAPKRYGATTGDTRLGGNSTPPTVANNAGGTAVSQDTTYLVLYKVENLIAWGGEAQSQTITTWILSAEQYDNFKSGGLTEEALNAAAQGSGSANVMQRTTLTATQKASFSVNDYLCFLSNAAGDYQFDEIRVSNANLAEVVALPPSVPTGLVATPAPGQVALTWAASTGAAGYNVKRSTTSGAEVQIGTASATTYTDTTVTNGTTYYYMVSATNSNGESANSTEASATPTAVKGNQTITFALGTKVTKTFGAAPFADTATASSALTVAYSSDNTAVATVAADGTVTITGAGTAHILADQAGDTNWNPAPQVSQTLTVRLAVAQLGQDYVANPFTDSQVASFADTAGTGTWEFHDAPTEDHASLHAQLAYTTVAHGGVHAANSFGDPAGDPYGFWLPGVSSTSLILGSGEGSPNPAHNELAIHPGPAGNPCQYLVLRWTAGSNVSGPISIAGKVRKLTTNQPSPADGITFAAYLNGSKIGNTATIANADSTGYTFNLSDNSILPGQTVDFVIGPNTNWNGDNSAISATITVAPTGTGYASWAATHGIPGAPATGDFDLDGLSNLLEYGLGLDPAAPNGSAGTLTGTLLSFIKGADAVTNGDVTWTLEESDDLGLNDPWTAVAADDPGLSSDATTISYLLPDGKPKTFARLVVTQAP